MRTLEEKLAELRNSVLTEPNLDPKYKTNMFAFTMYGDYNELLQYSESFRARVDNETMEYFILGFEKTPTTNVSHGQGFAIFSEPISFFTARRIFGTAHIEKAKDSATANISYCQKDGQFITFANKKYFYAANIDLLKKSIYNEV